MQKQIFKICFLFAIFFAMPIFVQAAPEVANNGIDEDGDGWLGTDGGYQIRASHPRVLLDSTMLSQTIDRMYGANAREPYKHWFDLIKAREDLFHDVDLANLALIYKATGLQIYKDRFIASIPVTGKPSTTELYAMDIMFDDLDSITKENLIQRVNNTADVFYWNSVNESNNSSLSAWGYHSAIGVTPALAYAGLFAYSGFESISIFNVNNYLNTVKKELYPGGNFYNIERRVGGDPTYNDALPGSFGGMYDNFGYDVSSESDSIFLLLQYKNLTGDDQSQYFLHDKYKGDFYQNMQYPYLYDNHDINSWCRRAGTVEHRLANIWSTQTDYFTEPGYNVALLNVLLYQDKRSQYYVENGIDRELCGAPYGEMYWNLIFYDDSLEEEAPATNQTAEYFSGPGLVSVRSDWSNDATFGIFSAGEGISRRYEDGNSFLLGRKTHVVVQGGARIRGNFDNEKTHWYHIRSVSKNTLKIFDPLESFDINQTTGITDALHSGPKLVPSDNLGGQIFETAASMSDQCYYAPDGNTASCRVAYGRSSSAFPLGVYETANVTKFEHNPTAGYTYSVGDATAAYTKKIDFFEREFLYLRPDTLVIFDRVKSVDPNFKKVWTIHTVDEPVAQSVPNETGLGMKANVNNVSSIISNPVNTTYIDSLLPKQNRVVSRGGDTSLVKEKPLRAGQDIVSQDIAIANTDIPRWLEFLGVGSDGTGSLVVSGATQEGDVSETINFAGILQADVSNEPDSMTSVLLIDTSKKWTTDQWKNYGIRTRCGGDTYDSIITSNTETTISATFPSTACWHYQINKYVANSHKHWTRIDSITTTDLDFNYLTVSVPHYFDAAGANGQLYTFAPHTDGSGDGYTKRKDLGQWTFEVEATQPQLLDNFLNVMSLKDPGVSNSDNKLIEGVGFSGVVIDNQFAIFANDKTNLNSIEVAIPKSGTLSGLFLDLIPNTNYYYKTQDNVVSFSSSDNGGALVQSSAMGTANVSVDLIGEIVPPAAPTGLSVM